MAMIHLKLEVLIDGTVEDIAVTADPQSTIGQLAAAIEVKRAGRTSNPSSDLRLAIASETGNRRVVAATTTIAGSGLRSGDSVSPTSADATPTTAVAAALLTVVDGPDAPMSVELPVGIATIGRGERCTIRLSDPHVSHRHARLEVSDTAEIIDDGSANGIRIGGRITARATLVSGDAFQLGDTTLAVSLLPATADRIHPTANSISFNRSPRLDPYFGGIELVAPEPPQPPPPHRFPVISMLAPMLIAGSIYAVTRSLISVLFIGLSPILMIGSWLENRIADKKMFRLSIARYRSALRDLSGQLEYARTLERWARWREHPSVSEVLEAVRDLTAVVWTRRPEHDSFLKVRLGVGTQPSRNSVRMPSARTLPEFGHELDSVVSQFANVEAVPVIADIGESGNIGIAGAETTAAPVMRGLIAQFAALHAPAELVVTGFGRKGPEGWDWMKWLPHVGSSHSPLEVTHLAADHGAATALAAAIDGLIDERLAHCPAAVEVPIVLVFVHDDAPIERARLVQIAERGPSVGVHTIWLSATVDRLPAACRTFVVVDPKYGPSTAGFVQAGIGVADLHTEPAGVQATLRFARRLSPVVDSGAVCDVASDLPCEVSLLELTGHELADSPAAVIDRWRENRSLPSPRAGRPPNDSTLRAVVGRTAQGPLVIDLRSHGPHALVGGTTGSGKSEFLQSWILSLATTHSPHRVTFLLVDYKGGAAFADCVNLPHCVGLVTDLNPHLVRRALTSLDAELRFREELLHARGAKDLIELERRGEPDTPPSLVIVVDEFAALVTEVPEFVDGVLGIAQRGRSLGLHLVLATQRPAGVINDHLRANTNLRVALRMADESDAIDVTGSPVAAGFNASNPGRAVLKSGPGRVALFQSAYVGGRHANATTPPPIAISNLRFGAGDPWEMPIMRTGAVDAGLSDIQRIVRTVTAAADDAVLPAPRRPWLPTLAPIYRLESLPTCRTDRELVIGVVDQPLRQAQREAAFIPDLDGNMVVFGAGGSGKSSVLRSVAVAAGLAHARGSSCWIYGLDFGSRGLQMLDVLPHVGAVIAGDDHERIARLLRRLKRTIDDRALRCARSNASTIDEYRTISGNRCEARIVPLIDGAGAFRMAYEGGPLTPWWDLFQSIATDGRAVGIHVVVTADRPSSISPGLAATMQRRLVLRLANDMDYSLVDVPTDAFGSQAPPGRGFMNGEEVQIGVIGGSANVSVQASALRDLADSMRRAGVQAAPPVESLPERIALSDLPPATDRWPTFGISDESLSPIGFEPTGTFLVAGAPQSGRSTTLATMARSLETAQPDSQMVLIAARRSALSTIVKWTSTAVGESEIGRLVRLLIAGDSDELTERHVIVIESIGDLVNTDADLPLQDLIRACRATGAFVIAEGESSTVTGSWPLLQAVKSARSGIVLRPDQMDGETLLKTPFPRTTRPEFPVGRGLLVQAGVVRKVQIALPE